MNQITTQFLRFRRKRFDAQHPKLGHLLLEENAISFQALLTSLIQHKTLGVPLGQVLVSRGDLEESRLYDVLARQWRIPRSQANVHAQTADLIGRAFCLEYRVVPTGLENGILKLASSSQSEFSRAENALQDLFGLITMVVASPTEIRQSITSHFAAELAQDAATQLPKNESCRGLAENTTTRVFIAAGVVATASALLYFVPNATILALTVTAVFLAVTSTILKTAATLAHFRKTTSDSDPDPSFPRNPSFSIMVPLHREPDIAPALVKRLSRLTYPKPLLEIFLLVEENDLETAHSLNSANLPAWMRVLIVPEGHPKTKPRALNHAIRFCKGDLIGIYDAEDAPDPDQLERVAAKFLASPSNVACVQGILQYYNPTQNWLARCFSIDYAIWFRVVLPGISRLGLPVPLGGTTLFLKRPAIEAMYGWDAHNVTEDADLGIRLHRHGYRTELISSVTGEEANCHIWPWIKQRSRWIKGYMVTYWAHMRNPIKLYQDIGLKGFLGIQALFLGTILHFITAPLLWAFWLSHLGVQHPYFQTMPEFVTSAIAMGFIFAELMGFAIICLALSKAKRLYLIPWAPTMMFYFLLMIPAGLKAAWEFVTAPVYWDKTEHGHSLTADDT